MSEKIQYFLRDPNTEVTIEKATINAIQKIRSWSDDDLEAFIDGTIDPEKEMDLLPTTTEGFTTDKVMGLARIELISRGLAKHPQQKEDEVFMGNYEGNYETFGGEVMWEERQEEEDRTTFEEIQWMTKRKGEMDKDGLYPIFIKRSEWEEIKRNKDKI